MPLILSETEIGINSMKKGSLNYTEYTYRIEGNTICMKAKGVDSEEECYEYDPDTRTLKNEQGAVYYRQVAE